MTLNEHIKELIDLRNQGYGEFEVVDAEGYDNSKPFVIEEREIIYI